MSQSLWALPLAGAVGAALGVLYFEGLWMTTSRLAESRLPGLLLAVGFAVRAAVLGFGLFVVMSGGLWRLGAALAGVAAARALVVRRHRPPARSAGEAGEA